MSSATGAAALVWASLLLMLGLPAWPLAALCIVACTIFFRQDQVRARRVVPERLSPASLRALTGVAPARGQPNRAGTRQAAQRASRNTVDARLRMHCYVGKGGLWEAHHSFALHQAAAAEDGLFAAPGRQVPAAGQWVNTALLSRNILAVGAPGCGKSSLLVLLAWQAQLRGEAVLVLDPKGAHSLQSLLAAGARSAKRPFLTVSLASQQSAVRYDPFRHCEAAGDIATRLCSLIGHGREDPFRDFCWGVLCTLAEVFLARGERPTLADLRGLLPDAGAALLPDSTRPSGPAATPRERAAEQALRALLAHDRTHYRKMTVALLPVLELLCTGPLSRILEGAVLPQAHGVRAGQARQMGPLLDLEHCRAQGTSIYIGLDALGHPKAAEAFSQLLLEDLANEAARRLASRAHCTPLNIMADEAGEIACTSLLRLLGKGREAGVRVLLAVQTLADLEWQLEGRAAAQVAYGNAGAWFLFRQLDAFSRRESAARLGELAVARPSSMRGHSESSHGGHLQRAHSIGEGQTREFLPRIPESFFALLRDLECLAQLPDGQLRHLRLPLPVTQ